MYILNLILSIVSFYFILRTMLSMRKVVANFGRMKNKEALDFVLFPSILIAQIFAIYVFMSIIVRHSF